MNKKKVTDFQNRIVFLVMTGVFAAMITIMTAYICHIPYGANGGYIHLGDALIYLAAVILPKPYAIAAAVIGGGMADILTAPMWFPATVVIKGVLVLAFTSKSAKLLNWRNLAAPVLAGMVSVAGYYLAEGILFGSFATALVSVVGNVIQAAGSMCVYLILSEIMEKAHVKRYVSIR